MNTETITNSYIESLIWSSGSVTNDDTGETLEYAGDSGLELSDDARNDLASLVSQWVAKHDNLVSEYLTLGLDEIQLGHDLALTSGGHGTGFWDRDLGALGESLTTASKDIPAYGESLELWIEQGYIRASYSLDS